MCNNNVCNINNSSNDNENVLMWILLMKILMCM